MMDTHVVIMAGGIGSRLWPLSTPERPKQFIDVLGVGKSLIQLTVERFLPVCAPDKFWVVTSEKYVDIVREQLPDIPVDQILAEPEARNTAPCIAYACWKIAQRHPAANIVVTPADALVLKTDPFADAIRKALAATEGTDAIVTVGITPTRPETGYGYIHAAEAVPGEVVKVSAFKEKPDAATAEAYLADGHYFWNAGIFVWNVKTITRQLRAYAPQIAGVMDTIAPALFTDAEASVLPGTSPGATWEAGVPSKRTSNPTPTETPSWAVTSASSVARTASSIRPAKRPSWWKALKDISLRNRRTASSSAASPRSSGSRSSLPKKIKKILAESKIMTTFAIPFGKTRRTR